MRARDYRSNFHVCLHTCLCHYEGSPPSPPSCNRISRTRSTHISSGAHMLSCAVDSSLILLTIKRMQNGTDGWLQSVMVIWMRTAYYDRMSVHRNRFLVNKTNRSSELQFYSYYDSTCFGQPLCPSSGVLSRISALVHFMQMFLLKIQHYIHFNLQMIQVVLAGDKEDLEYMTRKLKETYEKWGLDMNFNKTKYLCAGGTHNNLKLDKDN